MAFLLLLSSFLNHLSNTFISLESNMASGTSEQGSFPEVSPHGSWDLWGRWSNQPSHPWARSALSPEGPPTLHDALFTACPRQGEESSGPAAFPDRS